MSTQTTTRVRRRGVGPMSDDSIPVGELRELVDEWNKQGVDGRTASIFKMCSDDLESLIEGHTDE